MSNIDVKKWSKVSGLKLDEALKEQSEAQDLVWASEDAKKKIQQAVDEYSRFEDSAYDLDVDSEWEGAIGSMNSAIEDLRNVANKLNRMESEEEITESSDADKISKLAAEFYVLVDEKLENIGKIADNIEGDPKLNDYIEDLWRAGDEFKNTLDALAKIENSDYFKE